MVIRLILRNFILTLAMLGFCLPSLTYGSEIFEAVDLTGEAGLTYVRQFHEQSGNTTSDNAKTAITRVLNPDALSAETAKTKSHVGTEIADKAADSFRLPFHIVFSKATFQRFYPKLALLMEKTMDEWAGTKKVRPLNLIVTKSENGIDYGYFSETSANTGSSPDAHITSLGDHGKYSFKVIKYNVSGCPVQLVMNYSEMQSGQGVALLIAQSSSLLKACTPDIVRSENRALTDFMEATIKVKQ